MAEVNGKPAMSPLPPGLVSVSRDEEFSNRCGGEQPEYVYGRIAVSTRVFDRFLKRDSKALRLNPTTGMAEMIAHVYACTPSDVNDMANDIAVLGHELVATAKALREFAKTHTFPGCGE